MRPQYGNPLSFPPPPHTHAHTLTLILNSWSWRYNAWVKREDSLNQSLHKHITFYKYAVKAARERSWKREMNCRPQDAATPLEPCPPSSPPQADYANPEEVSYITCYDKSGLGHVHWQWYLRTDLLGILYIVFCPDDDRSKTDDNFVSEIIACYMWKLPLHGWIIKKSYNTSTFSTELRA